jgi:hypothetical protein
MNPDAGRSSTEVWNTSLAYLSTNNIPYPLPVQLASPLRKLVRWFKQGFMAVDLVRWIKLFGALANRDVCIPHLTNATVPSHASQSEKQVTILVYLIYLHEK